MNVRLLFSLAALGLTAAACHEDDLLLHVAPDQRPPRPTDPVPPGDGTVGIPPPSTPPGVTVRALFDRCLGLLGKNDTELEDLCPRNRETDECHPNFISMLQRTRIGLVSHLDFGSYVSVIDVLSGEGTIPATALVDVEEYPTFTTNSETGERQFSSNYFSAIMLVTPGNHYPELFAYYESGATRALSLPGGSGGFPSDFYNFNNVPLDHLRCQYDLSNEGEEDEGHYMESFDIAWGTAVPPGEVMVPNRYSNILDARISSRDGDVRQVSFWSHDADESVSVGMIDLEVYDSGVLVYALKDQMREGRLWMRELSESANLYPSTYEGKTLSILYWPDAVEWEGR